MRGDGDPDGGSRVILKAISFITRCDDDRVPVNPVMASGVHGVLVSVTPPMAEPMMGYVSGLVVGLVSHVLVPRSGVTEMDPPIVVGSLVESLASGTRVIFTLTPAISVRVSS